MAQEFEVLEPTLEAQPRVEDEVVDTEVFESFGLIDDLVRCSRDE